MTDNTNQDELERLRDHNKQLLAELKTARGELASTNDALQAAETARDQWKTRWYKLDIEAPLEADLRGCAVGPWKYLRDVLSERGMLQMQADDQGVERPHWFDEKGKPADLSKGLHHFLSLVCQRTNDDDLAQTVRGSGSSGGGAFPSPSLPSHTPQKSPEVHKQPAPQLGLR